MEARADLNAARKYWLRVNVAQPNVNKSIYQWSGNHKYVTHFVHTRSPVWCFSGENPDSDDRLIRSATFLAMKGAPMADLEGTFGIAWDVGFVGYFSNGVILDGDGLINGREIARMQKRDRLQNFVSSHSIKFVFANDGQLGDFWI
jgi:hypothetical protein